MPTRSSRQSCAICVGRTCGPAQSAYSHSLQNWLYCKCIHSDRWSIRNPAPTVHTTQSILDSRPTPHVVQLPVPACLRLLVPLALLGSLPRAVRPRARHRPLAPLVKAPRRPPRRAQRAPLRRRRRGRGKYPRGRPLRPEASHAAARVLCASPGHEAHISVSHTAQASKISTLGRGAKPRASRSGPSAAPGKAPATLLGWRPAARPRGAVPRASTPPRHIISTTRHRIGISTPEQPRERRCTRRGGGGKPPGWHSLFPTPNHTRFSPFRCRTACCALRASSAHLAVPLGNPKGGFPRGRRIVCVGRGKARRGGRHSGRRRFQPTRQAVVR